MQIKDNEPFIVKGGSRYRVVVTICLFCKKEFYSIPHKKRKFCSNDCANISRYNTTYKNCNFCNQKFKYRLKLLKKNKTGFFFCSRKCKDLAQRINGLSDFQPEHYGTSKRSPETYRRIYKEHYNVEKLSCFRCNYNEFECSVDIHHIDEDSQNNDPVNLIALCTCCHRALHKNLWSF